MTTFPGSQPVSIRELQAANRRLVSATKRRDKARKALAAAERQYRDARAVVRTLLEFSERTAPTPGAPVCPSCGALLGKGTACLECSGTRAFIHATGG